MGGSATATVNLTIVSVDDPLVENLDVVDLAGIAVADSPDGGSHEASDDAVDDAQAESSVVQDGFTDPGTDDTISNDRENRKPRADAPADEDGKMAGGPLGPVAKMRDHFGAPLVVQELVIADPETAMLHKPDVEKRAVRSTGVEESYFAIETGLLWDKLDLFRDELASDTGYYTIAAAAATGVVAVLTVGYTIWTVRAGYLVTSLLASLPAWRLIDPLPILAAHEDAKGNHRRGGPSEEEEESLQSMIDGAQTDSHVAA
jgi:hypothetical protein